jgi:hypothetical protein
MDIGRFASPPMDGSLDSKVMLEHELQRIYESERKRRVCLRVFADCFEIARNGAGTAQRKAESNIPNYR